MDNSAASQEVLSASKRITTISSSDVTSTPASQKVGAGCGSLYVVATPIGNLEDMTSRAIAVLNKVNIIAAEDTRHSSHLLQHFGITTKAISYHDFNSSQRVEQLIAMLITGNSVALISDAGTPLISDPGFKLVRQVREAGIEVVPVPGACAATTALSVAGLPSDRFIFEGFLANKKTARQKQLQALQLETRSAVFYESPHRILASLQDFSEVFGDQRQLFIARELTKTFETLFLGSVQQCLEWTQADPNRQRGEFVLILAGADKEQVAANKLQQALTVMNRLLQEVSIKQAVAIAADLTGARKNTLYQLALEQSEESRKTD